MSTNITMLTGQISKDDDNPIEVSILFDYISEETSTVEADITDNWVESNYSIQDHIAIKPKIYRLRGCVGEVVHKNQWKVEDFFDDFKNNHPVFNKTMEAINSIGNLLGIVSNYTQAAMNIAKQIESSIDRYKSIWKNFTNQNTFQGQHQAYVYNQLMQMLQTRTPVKLTGLIFKENLGWFAENAYERQYYLQSVSGRQGDSAFISDIEVTIKEFRIATTITTKFDKNKYAGLTATQKVAEATNGLAKGTNVQNPLGQPDFVKNTLGKATEISEAPKETPGHFIKTFTLKTLENAKTWVRNF